MHALESGGQKRRRNLLPLRDRLRAGLGLGRQIGSGDGHEPIIATLPEGTSVWRRQQRPGPSASFARSFPESPFAGPVLIYDRKRKVMMIWTVPVHRAIRDRLGTAHDTLIGVQLRRAGLTRERLAARGGLGDSGAAELPVWVVPNGWQGIDAEKLGPYRENEAVHDAVS